MTVKTYTLSFDGYWRPPNVSGLLLHRGFALESEGARFKAKLGVYLKELYL